MNGQAYCRTEKAQVRRTRRFFVGLLIFGVAALGGAGYLLKQSSEVYTVEEPGIRSIRIAGELIHLKRKDLESAVAEALDGGFFSLDVEAVRKATLALPWVADASVRRIWPHSLHITVTERRPIARWDTAELLEASGQRFTPAADTIPPSLPLFLGPIGSEGEVLEVFQSLRPRLAAIGLGIKRVQLSARRTWSVRLEQGPVVVLDAESLSASVQRLVDVWPNVLAAKRNRIESIDMRYANGFAVRWREPMASSGEST